MKRTKLRDRVLPDYTRGEEIFNMVTHICGGVFGIGILTACCCVAVVHHSLAGLITSIVYGFTVISLYVMSSVYHGLMPGMGKTVMQVLDHCTIYGMIAGTYTPIAVCAIVPENKWVGWLGLLFAWSVAVLAMVLTAIDLRKYRVFSMICYLGIGWSCIFIFRTIYDALGMSGSIYLIGGGVLYTIGAVLYGFGRAKRYMHSVFHLFVIAGSVSHFLCIVLYVL